MEYPKISIVTPNYNMAPFLEQTIQSVLGQGYPNLEYIIIDGGSTDGSVDIIKKYEHQLTYWVSEPDKGMYDAIQKGFGHSTGEIMAWINSDDYYHPGAFGLVAELFAQFPAVDWLSGNPTSLDDRGRTVYVSPLPRYPRLIYFVSNRYEWIQQESTFWRRALWEKAGGHVETKLQLAGDFELWMRFFHFSVPTVVNVLLGAFRLRQSGQKSLEGEQAYRQEVAEIIARERTLLSLAEKRDLKKWQFYAVVNKIPGLKHFFQAAEKQEWLLNASPIISFDRTLYRFIVTRTR